MPAQGARGASEKRDPGNCFAGSHFRRGGLKMVTMAFLINLST
jgi:hypothetical protein